MQLAVLCVVLAYLCFVTATPHGYGVKGGAAAKADAGAVAGAYSGLGAIAPIPFGPGFSGSYTKSSSSSSASSSASASSSSYSFSGSGYIGGSGGCATGTCPNSGAQDRNSYHNTGAGQNSGAINGNQNYNTGYPNNAGAYTGAAAQAGVIAGSQVYFGNHNNAACTGNNCFNKQGDCKGPTCSSVAGGVESPGKNCESGKCFPASSAQPSSLNTNDNKNNCASGQCGSSLEPGTISSNGDLDDNKNENPNKCQSGQCDTSATQACSEGQCSPSATYPNSPSAFGSINSPHSKESIKGTPSSISATIPSSSTHGYNSEPHSDSLSVNDGFKCSSGQCKPSFSDVTIQTSPDNEDISVNIQKNTNSKSNVNNEGNDYEKAIENSKGLKPPSNCANGNCASVPVSSAPFNNPGTYQYSSPNVNKETSKCNSPDCKYDIYNHAAAAAEASGTAYNKPATYLTTPKQESSCSTPNCKPASSVPGHHGINVPVSVSQPNIPYNEKKPFDCVAGQCGNNQPNSYFPSSSINSPNPTYGSSGYKCTSPNCAPTPQSPSYQSPHSHNVAQPAISNDIPSYKPTLTQGQYTPSINNPTNKPFNYQQGSSPNYTPSIYPNNNIGYQHNQPQISSSGPLPNQDKVDDTTAPNKKERIPAFVALTMTSSPQPCSGNGCTGVLPAKPNLGTNGLATPPNVYTGLPSIPSFTTSFNPPQSPSVSTAPGTHSIHAHSNSNKPTYDNRDKPAFSSQPCNGNGCTGDFPDKPNLGTNGIATPSHVYTGLPSIPSFTTSFNPPQSPSVSTAPGTHSIHAPSNLNKPTYDNLDKPAFSPQPCNGNGCTGVLPEKPSLETNGIATPSNVHTGLPSLPSFTTSFNPPQSPSVSTAPGTRPIHAPSNTNKPSHDSRDKPTYTGGFGGPAGLLKPNDYSLPSSIPAVGHPGVGEKQPVPCSTGNCDSNHVQSAIPASNAIPAVAQNAASCTTGTCGPQNGAGINLFNGVHASAGAAASANAIIYTGGFGGPPGFLKPYDGGNIKGLLASVSGKGALLNDANGGSPAHGVHSHNYGAGSGAQAFASAAAGATAGTFGGHPGHYALTDGGDNKSGRGCSGGCSPSSTDSSGSGLNSHYNAGLSLAKAGAVSGANAGSFGIGGSFASSSASAHASAGAAVKGYGRR